MQELRDRETHRLAPESAKARTAFIGRHAKEIAERTGISPFAATKIVERQLGGILLPDLVLPFDDPQLGGATVANVLAEPERFEGATLADPVEGIEYGRGKAKVMRRADGSPWIHSFAHGRRVYELRFDLRAVQAELEKADAVDVADLFVTLALAAELGEAEIEILRDAASARSGAGKRLLDRKLKGARWEHAARRADEERTRRAAERRDTRVQLDAPLSDAARPPVASMLDDILLADQGPGTASAKR